MRRMESIDLWEDEMALEGVRVLPCPIFYPSSLSPATLTSNSCPPIIEDTVIA